MDGAAAEESLFNLLNDAFIHSPKWKKVIQERLRRHREEAEWRQVPHRARYEFIRLILEISPHGIRVE